MYEYNARVTKVYDGDTITVDIDLGLGVWVRGQKIRLYGINTPEVRGAGRETGLLVANWVRDQLLARTVRLRTLRDSKGKYGRWLGIVYLPDTDVSINRQLVDRGYALLYDKSGMEKL